MPVLKLMTESLFLHLLLFHLHNLSLILLEYGLYLIFIRLLVLMGIIAEHLLLWSFLLLPGFKVVLGLASSRANTAICAHRGIHVVMGVML